MRSRLLASALSLLAMLVPATAAQATGRVYAGQPSGGADALLVLDTTAANDAVESLTIAYRLTCDTGESYWLGGAMVWKSATPPAVPGQEPALYGSLGPNGELSLGMVSAPTLGVGLTATESMIVSGQVRGSDAAGGLSGMVKVYDNSRGTSKLIATCTGTTPWRAIRKPGLVFGGHTSQNAPAVLELAPGKHRISHVHITTFAPCPLGGFWANRHNDFNGHSFRLTPGKTFRDAVRVSSAEKVSMSGRFYGARATGTLRWRLNDGSETCDSGPLTWFAATG